MFTLTRSDDAHDRNKRAMEARRAALIEAGQLGAPSFAPCAVAPGTDRITVQRVGPSATETTVIGVTIETTMGGGFVNLTPANARRIAVAILDAADEADATEKLDFTVEPTPARAAEALLRNVEGQR